LNINPAMTPTNSIADAPGAAGLRRLLMIKRCGSLTYQETPHRGRRNSRSFLDAARRNTH
jgi:hypothetical protein